MKKTIIITVSIITGLFAANVLYWILSDIQQECYYKIKNNTKLNFYEKSSIYSINLCICALGWPLSPEATIQQILCTVPTKDTIIMHSDFFANHEKIQSLMAKYPNATADKPIRVTWKADYNEFGLWSAYTSGNGRIALACNGMYLYKENGDWVISNIQEFAFPYLPEPTIIGPFRFHEIERLITKTGVISLAILAIIGIIATTISMFSIEIELLNNALIEDMIGLISLTLCIIVSFCFPSSFLINISRIAAKKENHRTSESC